MAGPSQASRSSGAAPASAIASHGVLDHAAGQSAPAGMRGGDHAAGSVAQQHRQAVGDHDRADGAGAGARRWRRPRASSSECIGIDDARAVHLLQPARRLRQQVAQARAVRRYRLRIVAAAQAEIEAGIRRRVLTPPLRVVISALTCGGRRPVGHDPVGCRRHVTEFAVAQNAAISCAHVGGQRRLPGMTFRRVSGCIQRQLLGVQRLPPEMRCMRAACARFCRRPDRRPAGGRATAGARGSGGCARFPAGSAAAWRARSVRATSIMRDRRLAARRPPPCACAASDGGRSAHRPCRRARCAPCTSARYSRLTVRACNWRTRSVCAVRVLATTSRPLVSLSSRCTMPARGRLASCGRVVQQRVEQRAAASCRCRDAPPGRPAC